MMYKLINKYKNLVQVSLVFLCAFFLSANYLSAKSLSRPDLVRVIFIPGIYGSKLQSEVTDDWLWGEGEYGSKGLSLLKHPSVRHELLEKDTIRVLGVSAKELKIYSNISRHLDLAASSKSSFSYDWRRSNRKSAVKLDKFICSEFQKNERIVFLAHSMGGLVLRHWINDFLSAKKTCAQIDLGNIHSFIFAGTPHNGSLEVVDAMITGESSITKQSFFSLMFGKSIVADAVTFESIYELLPAFNILHPSCQINDEKDIALNLQVDDGAGPYPLNLWKPDVWNALNFPRLRPAGFDKAKVNKLIAERLLAARDSVCSLQKNPPMGDLLSKMHFITGYTNDNTSGNFVRDTLNSMTVYTKNLDKPKRDEQVGDATVPSWSALPRWAERITQTTEVPRQHESLLDHGVSKGVVREFVSLASNVAGWVTYRSPSLTDPTLKELIEKASNTNISGLDSTSYSQVVNAIKEASIKSGATADQVYLVTHEYNGKNRDVVRSLGFSVAAARVDELTKPAQRLYAWQNAAFALYKQGSYKLSVPLAIQAGLENKKAQANGLVSAKILSEHDRKWKTVAERSLEQFGPKVPSAFVKVEDAVGLKRFLLEPANSLRLDFQAVIEK